MKFICKYFFCFYSMMMISQNKDIEYLYQIQKSRNVEYFNTMNGISVSVYPAGFLLPVSYFTFAYLKKDTLLFQKGFQSVISLGSDVLITLGIKYLINRPRPYEKYSFIIPLQKENTPSFPSGHTSIAFNIATHLSLNFPKWYVIIPSFLYASAVGYSRVYLGVHYPSDVLGGAVVGAGCAYLSYLWYQKYLRKTKVTQNITVYDNNHN